MAIVRDQEQFMFDRRPSIFGSRFTRLIVWLTLCPLFPALEGVRKPPPASPARTERDARELPRRDEVEDRMDMMQMMLEQMMEHESAEQKMERGG